MATVVVVVIGFSQALYTTSSSKPASTFAADDLEINVSKADELLDGRGLEPGSKRSGTVAITNAEHKARVTLGASGFEETPAGRSLSDMIRLTVSETSPNAAEVYSGRLSDLHAAPLGTFAQREQRSYALEIRWPADQDDPALAGAKTSFVFEWLAESVP
jgi:hypothetical protein